MKRVYWVVWFVLMVSNSDAQQQLVIVDWDSVLAASPSYDYLLELEKKTAKGLYTVGEQMTKALQLRYNEVQKMVNGSCLSLYHQKLLEAEIMQQVEAIKHFETYLTDSLQIAKTAATQHLKIQLGKEVRKKYPSWLLLNEQETKVLYAQPDLVVNVPFIEVVQRNVSYKKEYYRMIDSIFVAHGVIDAASILSEENTKDYRK